MHRSAEPAGKPIRRARAGGVLPSIAAGLLSCGCLSIETPQGFLIVEESPREIRALTPDDARLRVRKLDDPDAGTLEFWIEALRNDFVRNRGYTLVEESAVRDGDGHDGRQFLFESTVNGQLHRYLVAIFVVESWSGNEIAAVEFAAPKPSFDVYAESVRGALATLRP